MNILMIADDLTGANDSGVQLIEYGIRTSVLFHVDKPLLLSDGEAIVVDTDSRGLTKEKAYEKVAETMRYYKAGKEQIVYKKIDSTLRGNIGAEIDAMYEAVKPDFMIIAPAYPKNGRKTKDGYHYLNNTLVSNTEMAKDPNTPVHESFIPDLLKQQTNRQTFLVTISDLEKGFERVKEVLDESYNQHIPYIVFDAEKDEHLELIARYVMQSGYAVSWVGSAGLANELPEVYGFKAGSSKSTQLSQAASPVMLVVGSLSHVSRKQLEVVLQDPGVKGVEIHSAACIESEQSKKNVLEQALKQAIGYVSDGFHIAVYSTGSEEHIIEAKEIGMKNGLDEVKVRNLISQSLGEVCSKIVEKCDITRIVLTGGDTAKQVCNQLTITGFELMGEVEMGIPMGQAIGRDMVVITKAGAFGKDTSLLHAIRKLKGQ